MVNSSLERERETEADFVYLIEMNLLHYDGFHETIYRKVELIELVTKPIYIL